MKTINQLFAETPNSGTISLSGQTITVSHYPDAPDVYRFTGETVPDEIGNPVQVIVRMS